MSLKVNTTRLAALLGMTAVILGAFGAHALKVLLEPDQIETFKTGVLYHFIHTLAILATGMSGAVKSKVLKLSTIFFTVGILLFSGSLYLLSCRNILGIEHWSFLGPTTPIGGLFFIMGWISLLFIRNEK